MRPFFLDSSQLKSFLTEGYLKMDSFLPAILLERLRSFFEDEMNCQLDNTEKVIYTNKAKNYITNIENLF